MKLGRAEVQSWLDEVAPGTGLVRLAQRANLPRLRVTQQVSRGSVSPATIAAIAKALDLDPLSELIRFPEFSGISPGTPSAKEMVAFIPTAALLQATANRLNDVLTDESELGNEFYNRLPLNWFERADDGNLRSYLQQELGVTQPTLWKMLRTRLREDVALAVARYAYFTPVSALVVSGLLSGVEAGWEPGCRAHWVNTVSLGQLLEEAEKRLHEVGKYERSRETFEEHLG